MAFVSDPKGARGSESDKTTLAQTIIAVVGVTIIFGGLWLISEMNAPYHPADNASDGAIIAPSDG